MTPTDKITEGYGEVRASKHDERVAAGYQPTAMTDALEALAQRDANALTPLMRMSLGFHHGARDAVERVERGEGQ